MTDQELLWACIGGDNGWTVFELGSWEEQRLSLWHPVDDHRVFTGLSAAHGWNSDMAVSMRPYADRGSRRVFANSGAVWAVTESSRQVNALMAFDLEPTLVLRFGATVRHVAIWAVNRALRPDDGEKVNRHMAHRLRAPKKYASQLMVPPPGAVSRQGGKAKAIVVVGGSREPYAVGRVCRSLPRTIPDPLKWREAARG